MKENVKFVLWKQFNNQIDKVKILILFEIENKMVFSDKFHIDITS